MAGSVYHPKSQEVNRGFASQSTEIEAAERSLLIGKPYLESCGIISIVISIYSWFQSRWHRPRFI